MIKKITLLIFVIFIIFFLYNSVVSFLYTGSPLAYLQALYQNGPAVWNMPYLCKFRGDKAKDSCLINVAYRQLENADINICSDVSDEISKGVCLDVLFAEGNSYKKDNCVLFKEGENRDVCYMKVSNQNHDVSACDMVRESNTSGNKSGAYGSMYCYNKNAVYYKDYKICLKIKDPAFQKGCIGEVAVETNNYDLCSQSINGGEGCIFRIAQKKGDTEIMKNICRKLDPKVWEYREGYKCDKILGK